MTLLSTIESLFQQVGYIINEFAPNTYLLPYYPCKQIVSVTNYSFTMDMDRLSHFSNLQSLFLNAYNGSITPLKHLKNLKSLRMNFFNGDLSPLSDTTTIEQLDLPFFNGDLTPLKNNNIRKLSLVIFTGDLTPLKDSDIVELNLVAYNTADIPMKGTYLKKVILSMYNRSMSFLYQAKSKLDALYLSRVRDFYQPSELKIDELILSSYSSDVKSSIKVRKLNISFKYVSFSSHFICAEELQIGELSSDLTDIKPTLKRLTISIVRGSLKGIDKLTELSYLDINKCSVLDFFFLYGRCNLLELRLKTYKGKLNCIAKLTSLKKLKLEEFDGCICPIKKLTNLEELELNSFTGNRSNNSLKPLKHLKKLRVLLLDNFVWLVTIIFGLKLERIHIPKSYVEMK